MQQDINRLANLESHMQAQYAQAQQLQAQQIANLIYGSQQHIPVPQPNHRSPLSQSNYGSTPHLPQNHSPNQQMHYNNMRSINRIAG